ncbi:MAG: hypothetical protein AB8G77_03660 [Rhodothermales bacterium]
MRYHVVYTLSDVLALYHLSEEKLGRKTMTALHRICAYLLILIGIVHTVLTFFIGPLSVGSLWFAGTGLAFIFLGFINLSMRIHPQLNIRSRSIGIVANFIGLAFMVAAVIILGEPQTFVALGVTLLMTGVSFISTGASDDSACCSIRSFKLIYCGHFC